MIINAAAIFPVYKRYGIRAKTVFTPPTETVR